MYPTKNLEDFYDKEGYRDEEFDKKDKGTWIIRSEMTKQPKGKIMTSKGMVLHMNRNTRVQLVITLLGKFLKIIKVKLMMKKKISYKDGK